MWMFGLVLHLCFAGAVLSLPLLTAVMLPRSFGEYTPRSRSCCHSCSASMKLGSVGRFTLLFHLQHTVWTEGGVAATVMAEPTHCWHVTRWTEGAVPAGTACSAAQLQQQPIAANHAGSLQCQAAILLFCMVCLCWTCQVYCHAGASHMARAVC